MTDVCPISPPASAPWKVLLLFSSLLRHLVFAPARSASLTLPIPTAPHFSGGLRTDKMYKLNGHLEAISSTLVLEKRNRRQRMGKNHLPVTTQLTNGKIGTQFFWFLTRAHLMISRVLILSIMFLHGLVKIIINIFIPNILTSCH